MAVLTVSDVLQMPALRNAAPRVLAGEVGLGRAVRWVHSAELADIAPLLRAGDLLLSTGIAMPRENPDLEAYAASLQQREVAGLVIELGRRWSQLPVALIAACDSHGLPLVALTREVRFAAVAQAVGEQLVDTRVAELEEAQRVHDTFTELSIAEAGPQEILRAAQQLAGAAVVLESGQHEVLDYEPGPGDMTEFLHDWALRSRRIDDRGRTSWDETNGWLIARVGRPDRGWGRLIIQAPEAPEQGLRAIAERAASALALHRLHDRQRDSAMRRTHHELILGLLADPAAPDLQRRCELAGFPMSSRQFVGLSIRSGRYPRASDQNHTSTTPGTARGEEVVAPPATAASLAPARPSPDRDSTPSAASIEDLTRETVRAAFSKRLPALVSQMGREVRVLLSLASSSDPTRTVDDLGATIGRRFTVAIGAGRPTSESADIDQTLLEAQHVLRSLPAAPASAGVHRLEDVHLRGLVALMRDDPRIRAFVRRELDALRRYDATWGTDLSAAVKALVTHPTSKSDAAASLHVSRPVFYARLAKAGTVLGTDLDDAEVRGSLHFAFVADEIMELGA